MTEEEKQGFIFDETETPEEPEIFSVTKETGAHLFNRRRFIETSAVVAAGVVLTSCAPAQAGPASNSGANTNSSANPAATLPPEQTEEVLVSDTTTPTITNTPSPAPTETALPTDTEVPPTSTPITLAGQTLPGHVFLRSGPATYYPPVTKLTTVTHFVVIGRISDNSWVHVRLDNATEGWLYTVLTNVKANFLGDIQIDEAPPTPTPLPGTVGNTAPGTTGINYSYKDNYGNTYSYTLPCGSDIPSGAICTCNCVTACACDAYTAPCSCDGHAAPGPCMCDTEDSGINTHYWYPN